MLHAPLAVFVPVGPKLLELERLRDLADCVAAYETGPGWFVMVDDARVPRELERHVAPAFAGRSKLTPVALHHRRPSGSAEFNHGGGLCSSVLMALQWIQANTDAHVALKLDTDSLVIGPCRDRLAQLFDADPSLGMAGAYSLTPNHTPRDWTGHAATVMRLVGRSLWFDWRRPLQVLHDEPRIDDPYGRLIRTALDRGYDPGEHCLGGGYALSRALLDRLASAGYLSDPMSWMRVDLPEDVMVGAHVRAVAMTFANHVRPGDVFGVRYQGLPAPPAALAAQGYAVIHSVKNDPHMDEPTIRAFFKARRDATTGARSPDVWRTPAA